MEDENGCSITSGCTVINTAGILENNEDEVQIYPNPTAGKVFIQNNSFQSLVVKSVDGKIVKEIENISSKTMIDLSNEMDGVYFIYFIESETNHIVVKKILKKSR